MLGFHSGVYSLCPACGSSASGLEKAPPSPEGKSPSRSWSTWSRCHLAVHTKAFYTRVACRLPRDHCVSKPSFSEHYLVTNSITLTSTQVIRTRSPNLMLYLLGIENEMCIQHYSINPGRSPTFFQLMPQSPIRMFSFKPQFSASFRHIWAQFLHQRNPASRPCYATIIVAPWEIFLGSKSPAPLTIDHPS